MGAWQLAGDGPGTGGLVIIEHGTYAGWDQHRREHTPTCDACKAAQRNYMRQYRAATTTKCTPGLGWPLRRAGRVLAEAWR